MEKVKEIDNNLFIEMKTYTKYGIILYIENDSINPFCSIYIFDLKDQLSGNLCILNRCGEFKNGDVVKLDIYSIDEHFIDYGFGECTKINTDSELKEFDIYYKSLNLQEDEQITTAISNFVNLIEHHLAVEMHLPIEASVIVRGINELFNSQNPKSIKFFHHVLNLFYNQYERDLDYPIKELLQLFAREINEEKKKQARLKAIEEERKRILSPKESRQGGVFSGVVSGGWYTGPSRTINYAEEIRKDQIARDEMYDNFQEERALYKAMKERGVHY